MPAWLIRYLPHAIVALAVIAAVWWIDDQGYERAQADQAASERRITARIDSTIADIDRISANRLGGIRAADTTIIQPTITREIVSAPRYSAPDCDLTPGVFDALNQARALSGTAGADSGAVQAAPAAR